MITVYIGFDPREVAAFMVAAGSIRRHLSALEDIKAIVLQDLQTKGVYKRPTVYKDNLLHDVISNHPMSTEFAVSRFLVPYLNNFEGHALFVDCDVMALEVLDGLLGYIGKGYAVSVVKHKYDVDSAVKMDGQKQSSYYRKNWSSVCFWDCGHPANRVLTPEYVNSKRGADLHRFCWLDDQHIGELPPTYNHLVGVTKAEAPPKLVHFTNGIPHMKGYHDCEFADLWRSELSKLIPGFLRVIGTLPA
jgi:hypothetical protein